MTNLVLNSSCPPNPLSESNTKVLVQRTEDGWFYKGTLKDNEEDGQGRRLVEYRAGSLIYPKANFIIPQSSYSVEVNEGDACLAKLCGKGEECYGPGRVCNEVHRGVFKVEFYDRHTYMIAKDDISPISEEQFEDFSNHILSKDRALMGSSVLALNHSDGYFYKGKVRGMGAGTREYHVWWADGNIADIPWGSIVQLRSTDNSIQNSFDYRSKTVKIDDFEERGSQSSLCNINENFAYSAIAYDGNGVPMLRGDAVVAPIPSERRKRGVSKIFGITKDKDLALIFTGHTNASIPAELCYWLNPNQYNYVRETVSAIRGIDTLKIPNASDLKFI